MSWGFVMRVDLAEFALNDGIEKFFKANPNFSNAKQLIIKFDEKDVSLKVLEKIDAYIKQETEKFFGKSDHNKIGFLKAILKGISESEVKKDTSKPTKNLIVEAGLRLGRWKIQEAVKEKNVTATLRSEIFSIYQRAFAIQYSSSLEISFFFDNKNAYANYLYIEDIYALLLVYRNSNQTVQKLMESSGHKVNEIRNLNLAWSRILDSLSLDFHPQVWYQILSGISAYYSDNPKSVFMNNNCGFQTMIDFLYSALLGPVEISTNPSNNSLFSPLQRINLVEHFHKFFASTEKFESVFKMISFFNTRSDLDFFKSYIKLLTILHKMRPDYLPVIQELAKSYKILGEEISKNEIELQLRSMVKESQEKAYSYVNPGEKLTVESPSPRTMKSVDAAKLEKYYQEKAKLFAEKQKIRLPGMPEPISKDHDLVSNQNLNLKASQFNINSLVSLEKIDEFLKVSGANWNLDDFVIIFPRTEELDKKIDVENIITWIKIESAKKSNKNVTGIQILHVILRRLTEFQVTEKTSLEVKYIIAQSCFVWAQYKISSAVSPGKVEIAEGDFLSVYVKAFQIRLPYDLTHFLYSTYTSEYKLNPGFSTIAAIYNLYLLLNNHVTPEEASLYNSYIVTLSLKLQDTFALGSQYNIYAKIWFQLMRYLVVTPSDRLDASLFDANSIFKSLTETLEFILDKDSLFDILQCSFAKPSSKTADLLRSLSVSTILKHFNQEFSDAVMQEIVYDAALRFSEDNLKDIDLEKKLLTILFSFTNHKGAKKLLAELAVSDNNSGLKNSLDNNNLSSSSKLKFDMAILESFEALDGFFKSKKINGNPADFEIIYPAEFTGELHRYMATASLWMEKVCKNDASIEFLMGIFKQISENVVTGKTSADLKFIIADAGYTYAFWKSTFLLRNKQKVDLLETEFSSIYDKAVADLPLDHPQTEKLIIIFLNTLVAGVPFCVNEDLPALTELKKKQQAINSRVLVETSHVYEFDISNLASDKKIDEFLDNEVSIESVLADNKKIVIVVPEKIDFSVFDVKLNWANNFYDVYHKNASHKIELLEKIFEAIARLKTEKTNVYIKAIISNAGFHCAQWKINSLLKNKVTIPVDFTSDTLWPIFTKAFQSPPRYADYDTFIGWFDYYAKRKDYSNSLKFKNYSQLEILRDLWIVTADMNSTSMSRIQILQSKWVDTLAFAQDKTYAKIWFQLLQYAVFSKQKNYKIDARLFGKESIFIEITDILYQALSSNHTQYVFPDLKKPVSLLCEKNTSSQILEHFREVFNSDKMFVIVNQAALLFKNKGLLENPSVYLQLLTILHQMRSDYRKAGDLLAEAYNEKQKSTQQSKPVHTNTYSMWAKQMNRGGSEENDPESSNTQQVDLAVKNSNNN